MVREGVTVVFDLGKKKMLTKLYLTNIYRLLLVSLLCGVMLVQHYLYHVVNIFLAHWSLLPNIFSKPLSTHFASVTLSCLFI